MKLKNKIKIIDRKKLNDVRGWFLKAINGNESNLPAHTGEVYVTSAFSGCSRGSHYHIKATEWFILIQGTAILKLTDITSNEVLELKLESESPRTIVIPPKIAHSFLNPSDKEFILLAYTDELYDPNDTITFK